jgi:2-methylisocitrate lyase-like PEP mutase family enzyme
MSLRAQLQGALPVTAPLVLNPLMARMAEAAGFPAGYLGGGATGYVKVALEANLNLTEMYQAALDIRAVSSLPLLAQDFGAGQAMTDWSPVEHEMLDVIGIERLLAVERATVEKGRA